MLLLMSLASLMKEDGSEKNQALMFNINHRSNFLEECK